MGRPHSLSAHAACSSSRPCRQCRAFTLVELLVVIGIIAILIAILMPVLGKVKDQAAGTKCTAGLHQLIMNTLIFAQDHQGRLPGNESDYNQRDPEKRCWIYNNSGAMWQTAPETGTLWPYVKDKKAYLCPSRVSGSEGTTVGAGYSNGRFDYTVVACFTGARVSNIPTMARWEFRDVSGGPMLAETWLPTPYFVEETSYRVNQLNIDGGFSNVDEHSDHHMGGSYYAAIDGSVHYFQARLKKKKNPQAQQAAEAWQWSAKSPTRGMVMLGTNGIPWGWWDSTR